MTDATAERAILAATWLAGDFLTLLRLEAEDFADDFCRWLYGHLRALVEDEQPLDMVALMRRVRRVGMEGHTAADIAELLLTWHAPAHIDFYFATLRAERLRRAAARLAEAMAKRAITEQHDPVAVLAWAREQIERLLGKVQPRPNPLLAGEPRKAS